MFKNLFRKAIRLPLSEELIKLGDTYYITLTEKEKELRKTDSSIQESGSTHYVSRLRSLGFTNSKLVKNETDKIEKQISLIKTIKDADPNVDTTALESEIDRLVYQLYGLTDVFLA